MLYDNNYSISIHAPTRGATADAFVNSYDDFIFQSTLPREERLIPRHMTKRQPNFNPRSHERSDKLLQLCIAFIYYFNPRSHERSDKPLIYKALQTIISIHAPTRGATELTPEQLGALTISIHAPTRGATINP